jgi:hypothetical protein
MIKNQRSFVSKNSNSLNALIKKTSMTFTTTAWKRISTIFIAVILLSSTVVFNFGYFEAEAKKPGSSTEGPISWSNGFPSGPHSNVNIHGKKLSYNCDNDGKGPGADFGNSVFVPVDTQAARDANQNPTNIDNATIGDINFVSNKRSSIENAVVRDPCSAPFGNVTAGSTGDNSTAALVELPPGEHQVYWRILGNPFQGQGPDKDLTSAMITHPALIDQCNFIPSEFNDGTVVNDFDPDASGQTTSNLVNFQSFERFENFTVPDAGFSLTEAIYNDTDTDGFVSIDDVRLSNALTHGFVDGSTVVALDSDIGNTTFTFPSFIKYNDTNSDGFFSVGETVYNDTNTNNLIDQGDVRLANADSQGLPEDQGGDALSCDDETLVGLGLVSNKGVFDLEDGELTRFGNDDNVNEKGNGGKKGKSVATNMTGLFQWSGFVCDATELDGNTDNKLTFEDFDVFGPDSVIDADDINILNATALIGVVFTEQTLSDAEDDVANVLGDTNNNDVIDTEDEFNAWLDIILEDLKAIQNDDGFAICQEFTSEWVFNVADIVLYGFDYENKGSSLTQLRFYPTDTTNFEE